MQTDSVPTNIALDLKASLVATLMKNQGYSGNEINNELSCIYEIYFRERFIKFSKDNMTDNDLKMVENYIQLTSDYYTISMYGLLDFILKKYTIQKDKLNKIYSDLIKEGRLDEALFIGSEQGYNFKMSNEYIEVIKYYDNNKIRNFLRGSEKWLSTYGDKNKSFYMSLLNLQINVFDSLNDTKSFFKTLNLFFNVGDINSYPSDEFDIIPYYLINTDYYYNFYLWDYCFENTVRSHLFRNGTNYLSSVNISSFNYKLQILVYTVLIKSSLYSHNYEYAYKLKQDYITAISKSKRKVDIENPIEPYFNIIDQFYSLSDKKSRLDLFNKILNDYNNGIIKEINKKPKRLRTHLLSDFKKYDSYFLSQISSKNYLTLFDILFEKNNYNIATNMINDYCKILKRKPQEKYLGTFVINNLQKNRYLTEQYLLETTSKLKIDNISTTCNLYKLLEINFYMIARNPQFDAFSEALLIFHTELFNSFDNSILNKDQIRVIKDKRIQIMEKAIKCIKENRQLYNSKYINQYQVKFSSYINNIKYDRGIY